jgi:hypothetical protein
MLPQNGHSSIIFPLSFCRSVEPCFDAVNAGLVCRAMANVVMDFAFVTVHASIACVPHVEYCQLPIAALPDNIAVGDWFPGRKTAARCIRGKLPADAFKFAMFCFFCIIAALSAGFIFHFLLNLYFY